jgi:hypothetical protein
MGLTANESTVAQPQPSVTSASGLEPQNENYFYEYRNIENVYQGQYAGDWQNCNYVQPEPFPANYGCTQTVTVSASFSGGTSEVPTEDISALLGFSVTWSYSEGASSSFSVEVPAGGYGPVQAGSEYWQHYVVDQYRLCTEQGCDYWAGDQANTVQRRDTATYRYVGTY